MLRLQAAQSEASRNRGELVAGNDAHCACCALGEALGEDASHGGDEAGSSGEEDALVLKCREDGPRVREDVGEVFGRERFLSHESLL